MRTPSLFVGTITGIALGLGGVVAADEVTESADAQGSSQFVTKAEFNAANRSANQRASAAINGYKIANNAITKYFVPNNDLIGARSGPITQDRGTGANGLPGSTIQNGAIAREKIANEAVDSEKIAPGGVTSGDLADNSVQSPKVEAGAITSEKLAGGSVSTDKVAGGAVTEEKIDPSVGQGIAKFAHVSSIGQLEGNRGFVSASQPENGRFVLTTAFPVDDSRCAINATVNRFGLNAGFFAKYDVTDPNEITVFTYDENGNPNSEAFSLSVFCV